MCRRNSSLTPSLAVLSVCLARQLTLRRVMETAKGATRSGSLPEFSMVLLNNALSFPPALPDPCRSPQAWPLQCLGSGMLAEKERKKRGSPLRTLWCPGAAEPPYSPCPMAGAPCPVPMAGAPCPIPGVLRHLMLDPFFWAVCTASVLLGLAISFTSMWFLHQTSPTTYR